jgi:hypothetical protein
MDESFTAKIIAETRSSRKYRQMDLPEAMLREILAELTAKAAAQRR